MVFEPHPYQRYAIERIVNEPSVGLLLDMGLGKTVITLTAIDRLIYDELAVSRCLIIAPKKVAEATWQDEAAKWDHLRRLRIATALGSAKERLAAAQSVSDIVVINRENVKWLVETLGRDWGFDMVVFDESSSFKNPSSGRFKAIRWVLRKISRRVILTGTPAPNGLHDLWSQIFLLDGGERLERTVTAYRTRYFDFNPWRHEYTAKAGAYEAVQKRIGDICVSMKAEDYLQLPALITHDVPVRLNAEARAAYDRLERDYLLSVGEEEITAMSAAALTGKLLQLCGGSFFFKDTATTEIYTAKLEALSELIEALNGEPAILFYGYRHELPALRETLKGLRVVELTGADAARTWNEGGADILLAHPASCAYGLNLQQGGRHIIWYTLTWSLELYQQANARLHRQGQIRPVVAHRLLVKGGMDESVAKALEAKDGAQEALIEALKARKERFA